MHEHGLARELWPQVRQIAENQGFSRVNRIEMTVGTLHGVSADFLAHSFEHAFEEDDTGRFDETTVAVTTVDPGEPVTNPGADAPQAANGWELMITRIEGDK
ncbi:MAG: hydrogenase maturation nickel metallochaperone HypA [Phycisphaerae bacterium]|nr:hydrogenase maturation nickel metallochaperone HypA [Phycisphaerae bacterium]